MAECFTTGGLPFLQEVPTIHEFGEVIRLRVFSCLKPQVDAWMHRVGRTLVCTLLGQMGHLLFPNRQGQE